MDGKDSDLEYCNRLLSGEVLKKKPFEGMDVSSTAKAIADRAHPMRVWVPDSAYEDGKLYEPKIIVFCDRHGHLGEPDFLQYHNIMTGVLWKLLFSKVINPEKDRFLYESSGFTQESTEPICGRLDDRVFERAQRNSDGHLILHGFGSDPEKPPVFDSRHLLNRIFDHIKDAKPYTEFLDDPELTKIYSDAYYTVRQIRAEAGRSKDPVQIRKLARDMQNAAVLMDDLFHAVAMDKAQKIADRSSDDHMTVALIGILDMVLIDKNGGLQKQPERLDYICLVPQKQK